MKNVFFIDDEENILNSLKRAFRNESYTCHFFTSANEAIKVIKETKPHVVVSDVLMPEMNGFELLKEVKRVSPGTVRVMLTGYADVTTILHAMNSGDVYRFITKPWKLEDGAKRVIEESINYSDYLRSSISD